jgi:DNA-binding XRE family transcriptional regulator
MSKKEGEVKTLKEVLDEKSVNKTALTKKWDIGRQTLHRWENGETYPSMLQVPMIAIDLGMSLEEVYEMFRIDISGVPKRKPAESPDPWQN